MLGTLFVEEVEVMVKRGLALSLVLAMASIANAGAVVTLAGKFLFPSRAIPNPSCRIQSSQVDTCHNDKSQTHAADRKSCSDSAFR